MYGAESGKDADCQRWWKSEQRGSGRLDGTLLFDSQETKGCSCDNGMMSDASGAPDCVECRGQAKKSANRCDRLRRDETRQRKAQWDRLSVDLLGLAVGHRGCWPLIVQELQAGAHGCVASDLNVWLSLRGYAADESECPSERSKSSSRVEAVRDTTANRFEQARGSASRVSHNANRYRANKTSAAVGLRCRSRRGMACYDSKPSRK